MNHYQVTVITRSGKEARFYRRPTPNAARAAAEAKADCWEVDRVDQISESEYAAGVTQSKQKLRSSPLIVRK